MLACRPMISLALAAAAGVLAARFFPAASSFAPAGAGAFALALGWFFLRRVPPAVPVIPENMPAAYLPHVLPSPGALARRGPNAFLLALCAGCFALGLWRQGDWSRSVSPDRLPLREWVDATLVADSPQYDRAGGSGLWRVSARVLEIDGKDTGGVPVRLYGTSKEFFRRGDRLRARIRFSPPRPRSFPGAFDGAFWLERDGLAANANLPYGEIDSATGEKTFRVLPAESPPLSVRALRVLDAVRAFAIERTLARGGEHGGMLAAMLYGYRAELPVAVGDVFRRVGIGHVLAISGLHVGLVIGLLWWLAAFLPCSPRVRSLLCLAASVVYLGLSGGQVAAARATLMAVIHLGARACGRKSDMLNSLGAAAFLVIMRNPTAPLDVGFQLSFTAVVFIDIALSGWGRAKGFFVSRFREQLDSLVRLSVATSVGLFPIVATVFHQANPVGIPLNIVVVPMMGAVLVGGLLLPVLAWIPGAAFLLTLPADALALCARAADALPYSSFAVQSPPGWWVFAFYAFVFLSLLSRMLADGTARRRVLGFSLAGIAVAFAGMAAGMAPSPPPAESRLALLPGGAGLGVVSAETPGGGIALVGELRRQGMDEAEWLHFLRRSGETALVSFGRGRRDTLDSLAFQYPVAAQSNHPLTRRRDAGASPAWAAVPGAEGVEYAFLRNARGRAVALFVRCGGKVIATASRLAPEDAAAAAAFWRESGGGTAEAGRGIFVPGARGAALFDGEGLRVYDGREWRFPEPGFFLGES